MIRISDVRKVGAVAKRVVTQPVVQGKRAIADGSPAAESLTALIKDAVNRTATVVHIEPHGHDVVVRYRIDGFLRDGQEISSEVLPFLARRVKSLANLNGRESRVLQDGSFIQSIEDENWTIRATILPVADGEKIVLHLSNQATGVSDLQKLGFWGRNLTVLGDAAGQNKGLVIVGGPATHGVSATLYALMHIAADPSRSVASVEDPLEHRVPGVNQTLVNTKVGMTFADSLRGVLRQDPNVVMVSSVAEPHTVGLVTQAALSGRLIFAGVHTHDVAASIHQFVAMKVEPYVVATALRTVVNQRLVRRLCDSCKEQYRPTTAEFSAFCQALMLHDEGAKAHVASLKASAAQDLGLDVKTSSTLHLWRAKEGGCGACGQTGYKGRTAIAEVLSVNSAMQKLIFSNADGAAIYDQAMREGMIPLPLDGLVKASLGMTSVEELLRAMSE